jgi:signal transduction histidine kinase
MVFKDIFIAFILILSAGYFTATFIVFRKRGIQDAVSSLLVVYLVLSILWELSRAFSSYLISNLLLPENLIIHIPYYGLLIIGLLFWGLTTAFFREKGLPLFCWLIVLSGLIMVIMVDVNLLAAGDKSFGLFNGKVYFSDIIFLSLVITWALCMIGTAYVTYKSFHLTDRNIVKQRIVYWSLALILTISGGILFLSKIELLSSLFHFLGALTVSYIIAVPRLTDWNKSFEALTSKVIVFLIEILIFILIYSLINNFFPFLVRVSPFLTSLFLSLLLLLLYNPLLIFTKMWTGKFVARNEIDKNQILSEYSLCVSNIVDIFQLSSVAIEFILQVMDLKSGILFTVHQELDEQGESYYRLNSVPAEQESSPIIAIIPAVSPIAERLGDYRNYLLRSEIDVEPAFRFLTRLERGWLDTQEVEVLLPIHFRDEWVGVFAFGPKRSGDRYYDDEIELLNTLASQTAVALQNARLVNRLIRINSEFRRTYTAMEDAHSKLAAIERAKSDFISIASHELRTPMAVMSGYSQMLLDDTEINKDGYYRKISSGIYEGTTRLSEIVDSMLEIAKIDARALELKAEPVDVNILLNELLFDYKNYLKSRNLSLELDDLGVFPSVHGDPDALKKVFYHLLMNAIKFTPDGGTVSIHGCIIHNEDPREPEECLDIIVRDTGIGIDPGIKELIFNKFYQTGDLAFHSAGTTTFKGGGPGLGLTIVRGIVKAHGGRVWVESPGYDETKFPGSAFHVVLPINTDHTLNG